MLHYEQLSEIQLAQQRAKKLEREAQRILDFVKLPYSLGLDSSTNFSAQSAANGSGEHDVDNANLAANNKPLAIVEDPEEGRRERLEAAKAGLIM